MYVTNFIWSRHSPVSLETKPRVHTFSQKSVMHLKFLGARSVTRSKFDAEGPLILGSSARNLVALTTRTRDLYTSVLARTVIHAAHCSAVAAGSYPGNKAGRSLKLTTRLLLGPRLRFTSWSRVVLEKLTGSAASQEIPRIFGTRKFITVLTSARHLSLS